MIGREKHSIFRIKVGFKFGSPMTRHESLSRYLMVVYLVSQGNANQNHNEMPLNTHPQEWLKLKRL